MVFCPDVTGELFWFGFRGHIGVKRAFDGKGLLNPGKVLPTLQRCAEYGEMLVRGGKLEFSERERF